jgi:hypothetical protein
MLLIKERQGKEWKGKDRTGEKENTRWLFAMISLATSLVGSVPPVIPVTLTLRDLIMPVDYGDCASLAATDYLSTRKQESKRGASGDILCSTFSQFGTVRLY